MSMVLSQPTMHSSSISHPQIIASNRPSAPFGNYFMVFTIGQGSQYARQTPLMLVVSNGHDLLFSQIEPSIYTTGQYSESLEKVVYHYDKNFTYDLDNMRLAVESDSVEIPREALDSDEAFDEWLNNIVL